jgi:nucleotide-binding universal stress UspA family protein
MEGIKRIIIPVYNNEESKNVVKQGAYLAKLLGIEAKIITVNDTHQFISSVVIEEKLKKDASAFLEELKKIAESFYIKADTELITGKPSEEIVKFAKKDDLIILGDADRSGGINKVLDTSVLKEVVKNAPCSVLVVKTKF